MDTQVRDKIFQRLDGDSALDGFTAEISTGQNPDDPKALSGPLVVIQDEGGPDVIGLHGAAIDVEVEIKIWGYGKSMRQDCRKAAERISLLMLSGFQFNDGSVARKFREINGWQDVPDTDADTIHKSCSFLGRYWSKNRITALTS